MTSDDVVTLVAALADGARRAEVSVALAGRLGAEALLFLVRDHELDVLIPVAGPTPTLPGGAAWRAFLARCATSAAPFTDEVTYPDRSRRRPARAWPCGRCALVLIGDAAAFDDAALRRVLEQLPLLCAVFTREQEAQLASAQTLIARGIAAESRELARALDSARGELQAALAEQGRLNEALRRSERQKDEFLAVLAHELRNPLAAIVPSLHLARLRMESGRAPSREVAVIERQLELLVRMVDDLLDVSRISLGRFELRRAPMPLASAVARAVEVSEGALLKRGVELAVELSPEPLVVDGDLMRLTQAFTNLLQNAAKFTDRGGRVVIRERREDDHAVVSVHDTGVGIASDVLPRLFGLFFQANQTLARSQGGLGIGLSLVKYVVDMHGGAVSVRSDGVGKGAEFTVRLPLTLVGRSATGGVAAPVAASPSLRALVVDDDLDASTLLGELLQARGHEALLAATGEQALQLAVARRPDLVFLDLRLPDLDGFEVARRLRPELPDAWLVAMSGYGELESRALARAAGFDDDMVKPLDFEAIERAVSARASSRSAHAGPRHPEPLGQTTPDPA